MKDAVRGCDSAFPPAEYAARVAALRTAMAARHLDAALFTGPENIFYLTGQQTPGYYTFQALLLPLHGAPRFLLRTLEKHNFLRNTTIADYRTYNDGEDPAAVTLAALRDLNLTKSRIAIEKGGWFLPIRFYDSLRAEIPNLEDATGLVETLRRIKSPAEITAIEASARQADAGLAAGLATVREGITDNDIVAAMMQAAITAGAEYMGMEPLVSVGARSGIPHATWRRRPLAAGDAVFLEMSGCHNRYHTGLMRTAWLGHPPKLARELEAVVLEALATILDQLRPGLTCAEAHRTVQSVIDRAGVTDRYLKRSGYSLGIAFAPDWGEWQVMSLYEGVDIPLQPNMCFHIPITLREYGAFTIGMSESVVITETGCRILGTLPRIITIA